MLFDKQKIVFTKEIIDENRFPVCNKKSILAKSPCSRYRHCNK